jgi:GNAT superfamily N-acetyltransferase
MGGLEIRNAGPADVAAAADSLVAAFGADPLIAYFFHTDPRGIAVAARDFFSLLLRVRMALGMPALVLVAGERRLGVAMGYDSSRPVWPEAFSAEWARLEAAPPGFAGRLQAYERLSRAHEPDAPHHYLGVLGVDPSVQGIGAGRALLEAYCDLAAADPRSTGVYLETSSRASLDFYLRNHFVLRGTERLDDTPLWCVFRPAPDAAVAGGADV